MLIARSIHQEHRATTSNRKMPLARWHLALDQVNDLLREGGEVVLCFNAQDASLPTFSYFVEHRRDHSDQDIQRPAVRSDRFLHDQRGCLDIALLSCLKQRAKDV